MALRCLGANRLRRSENTPSPPGFSLANVLCVGQDERRAFTLPPTSGEYDGVDLSLINRDDPVERRLVIEAEHPELRRALQTGQREIHLWDTTVNPVLHIAMHEIVANQLWANAPPEVWQTAKRLPTAGYA